MILITIKKYADRVIRTAPDKNIKWEKSLLRPILEVADGVA